MERKNERLKKKGFGGFETSVHILTHIFSTILMQKTLLKNKSQFSLSHFECSKETSEEKKQFINNHKYIVEMRL